MKEVLETRSKEFSLYLHNFRNLKSPFCALSAARMTPIIFPEEEEEFLKREREWEHVMPSGYVRLLRLDIDTHTAREGERGNGEKRENGTNGREEGVRKKGDPRLLFSPILPLLPDLALPRCTMLASPDKTAKENISERAL
jgi:hypothetical protein